jgi:hypothetical protein
MPADIYDWIAQLKSNQWVLDVGSGAGSFPDAAYSCAWLALDEDPAAFTTAVRYSRVAGGSHQLPIADASIDLLICHHALLSIHFFARHDEFHEAQPEGRKRVAQCVSTGSTTVPCPAPVRGGRTVRVCC